MSDLDKLTASLDRDLAAMTDLAGHIAGQLGTPASAPPASQAPSASPAAEVHGPRVTVAPGSGMVRDASPPSQRAHLDDLVRRFTAKTPTSKSIAARYRRVLADSRAVVGFRRATKEMLYPLAGSNARGSRLEDVDGNSYVDITMGFGVLLFGHEPDFVREAVREHLARGIRLGPRSTETGEAAELLAGLTGMERVAFANSGTEANAAAIRLARAATGRDRIVTFQGAYHGHADNVLGRPSGDGTVPVSRGIPQSAVADLTVLTYGSEEALEAIERDASRIAAVVVEPVQSRHPALQPVEFVRRLRELTRRHGIVLLFDEMLTGFRPAARGAQELYGVVPDLATYGKLIGGGFPIGAIAGRADILDGVDGGYWDYGDDSTPPADTTFFGGTYLQHPVSMTAARAVLGHLKEHSPTLQERLNARTAALCTGLNSFFEEEEFPLRVRWFGSQFRFEHHADMELLYQHLLLRGVYVWEWRNFFLSTAHTDEDVAFVADAVRDSLRELRAAGFFPTRRPAASGQAPRDTAPVLDSAASAPTAHRGSARPPAAAPAPAPAPAQPPAPKPASPSAPPPAAASVPAVAAPRSGSRTETETAAASACRRQVRGKTPDFSLYFFGDYPQPPDGDRAGRYELLLEAARFADEHGFHALWMPERHFNSFGGLFPNPAVLASALSRETRRVRLNAGSVVLPLHDPIRVAEEWSMVDNLSDGRVGLGVASGWNANDFVFFPERFGRHKEEMFRQLEELRRFWRGEPLLRATGDGDREVRLFPRPVQDAPPMFTAVVGNPASYEQAARHDLGIVTNLMTQSVEQLAENIARYRDARAQHGLDPDAGRVAVLLHTYLGECHDTARAEAFEPMARYMRASLSLFNGVTNSLGHQVDLSTFSDADLDALFRQAYGRYCDQRSLIGTVEGVQPVVDAVAAAGADEIVALVDFGVPPGLLRSGLPHLDALRRRTRQRAAETEAPMSPGQERIWFHENLLPGRTAYNEVKAVRLDGPLDTAALREALRALVARHASLRTVFRESGGEPRQVVRAAGEPDFAVVDGGNDGDAAVTRVLAEESARRHDLAEGPLFHIRLVRTGPDRHVLVLSFHHLVVDAASATVLSGDLSALYQAARDRTEVELAPLTWSYAEHAAERRAAGDGPSAAADLTHWRSVLGGPLPVLDLPTDRPRPPVMTSNGRAVFRTLDAGLSRRLRELSRANRSTLFMTLLAGYAAMLHRVTGQEDIVVGTPVSDRPERAEGLIGFFVNTLALRFDLSGDPSFRTLLRRVRSVALDAYDHAGVPFETVVRELSPERRTDRTPVFQVLAEFQPAEPFRFDLPGITATPLDAGPDKALTDLTVYFTDQPQGIRCHLEYNSDLFDPETVDGFFGVLDDLLTAAADAPDTPLSAAVRTAADGDPVPESWERGAERPVDATTLHAWVARRAGERPDAPAILDRGSVLTYGELDERAGRLAAALREQGPLADDPAAVVAVRLPRSADLVVAALAVLKTGRAYVPLDPSLGAARAAQVIAECGARTVVCRPEAAAELGLPATVAVVPPDAGPTGPAGATVSGVPQTPDGASPCCVLYTSGSTGVPKGVVLTHQGLVDLCQWHHRRFDLRETDRSALVSSQSFDGSLLELWPALTAGASVAVADDEVRRDPRDLARWYAAHRVTVTFLPTALGEQVLRLPAGDQPPLRVLMLGGEALRTRPRQEAPYETVNIYGPTETTVLCTTDTVAPDGEGPVSIGRPADNVRLRVVDDTDKPVPVGAVGELLVGGPGLALGYRGLPDLTAERFMADPAGGDTAADRFYRTGDLVRWTPLGRLEFVGRRDDQVKIRGFRVEPEEAARALNELTGVSRAVVLGLRRENGEAYLAAYVEPDRALDDGRPEREAFAGRLAAELAARLPDHLVPRAWRIVPVLPLTGTGKLDRDALPAPDLVTPVARPASPAGSVSPAELERATEPVDAIEHGTTGDHGERGTMESGRTPGTGRRGRIERRLWELWAQEFGLAPEQLGADAHFFDLGGHSLSAMRLVNRVREEWGDDYPMVLFYQEPTLGAMAARLAGSGAAPALREGPATETQARFAELHAAHDRPQVFNVGLRITLRGPLDEDALRRALDGLVERHEALRTRLVCDGEGAWRQEVLAPRPVDFPVEDLTGLSGPDREAALRRAAERAAETPLDPATGEVLSGRLLRAGEQERTLLLVLHHCACDGWTVSLLLRELAVLYRALLDGTDHGLPSAPQQIEHAHRQAERDAATFGRRLEYWLRELDGADFSATVPPDRRRPETLSGRGGVVTFTVPAEVRADVQRLAARCGTTPFAVTAAALGRTIAGETGAADVLLNISYANRESSDEEALVACTVTGFTLRVRDAAAGPFADLVDRVSLTALRGMDHALPVRRIAPAMRERTGAEMPAMLPLGFAYQSSLDTGFSLPGVKTSVEDLAPAAARSEFIVVLTPAGDVLEGAVEYSSDLWDRETVESWTGRYIAVLRKSVREVLEG
ncbi:MupA/Atu3671 family FMN-dependent luciferase-like monooxygenase [Streptomyces sp. NPDC048106]|uniref:MupA/Atu3671 family FMN-dependent luciferase-like monooxygenase n=1 Tax=Streptomyces sp. NPDC048106 TaxID=3155750 RepID=UPI00345505F2